MLVRYLLSSRVCPPSVRLFVTSRCTTETAKCRISETPPQDSPETPVLRRKRSLRNSNGIIPNGGAKFAFVDRSRSLRLRLTAESLRPSATVIRLHDGALAEEDAVSSTTLMIVALRAIVYGVGYVILFIAILLEHRLVANWRTDRPTDGHRATVYTALA